MCSKPVHGCPNGPKTSPSYDIYYQDHCLCYPRSEEVLKIVEKSFIADVDFNNKCTYCDRSFYSYLIKKMFSKQKHSIWAFDKN